MKWKIQMALGLAVIAAGCATHDDKIVFADDAQIRAAASDAAGSAQKKLDKSDLIQIEQVVFGYFLARHFWDLSDYSAVFLSADDAQVAAIIKKYPDHLPPIKPSYHALLRSQRTPVDKDTHKPAMVLSVEVNEPNADDTVDALGRWYAGDAVTGFRVFRLQRVDGGWQIAAVK